MSAVGGWLAVVGLEESSGGWFGEDIFGDLRGLRLLFVLSRGEEEMEGEEAVCAVYEVRAIRVCDSAASRRDAKTSKLLACDVSE